MQVVCIKDIDNKFTKGEIYISENSTPILNPYDLKPIYGCLIRDDNGRLNKFYKSKIDPKSIFSDTISVEYFSEYFITLKEYRENKLNQLGIF